MNYFRVKPEIEFIETLIVYYGIRDIHSYQSFNKHDLIKLQTVKKITDELLGDLTIYYMPHIIKRIMDNFNEKKAITMLKQFLTSINYHLDIIHSVKEHKKIINYRISSELIVKNIQVRTEPIFMSFD